MKRKIPSLDKRYTRHRDLLPEEAALWQETLEGKKVSHPVQPEEKKPAKAKKQIPEPIVPAKPRRKEHLAPEAVDSRTLAKIRKGMLGIDASLDLHGHSRETAHMAVIRFVLEAQAQGKKLLLIITGKGKAGGNGILREELPRWLNESPLRKAVIAYDSAGPRHGGGGAWYIRIRKQRHQ